MMELASLPTLWQNDMTVAHTCACHYVEQLFLRDRGFGEGGAGPRLGNPGLHGNRGTDAGDGERGVDDVGELMV